MLVPMLRSVLIASATVALTMAQLNLPDAEFWVDRDTELYVALTGLALLAAYDSITGTLAAAQSASVREFERSVRSCLSEAFLEVRAEFPAAQPTEIGVHAFRIRGVWPFRRLVNIGGIRLGADPSMTRPVWKKGRGVVGRAWRERRFVAEDWEAVYAAADTAGASAWGQPVLPIALLSWWRRGRDGPYSLTWGELQLTFQYKRIVAIPTYASNGRLRGGVSIDTALPFADARSSKMRSILDRLAAKVGALDKPPRAWWGNRT